MEELAKLLGTTKEKLETLTDEMAEFTGKKDVPDKLLETVAAERKEALEQLDKTEGASAQDLRQALKDKVASTEAGLLQMLGEVNCHTQEGCAPLINEAVKIAKPPRGFFLKEGKARELLLANPPPNVMSVLGHRSAQDLVGKEDLYEVFASLRFVEDQKWLNDVFFAPYVNLTPDDFEERDIQVRVLEAHKWARAAAAFMKKKFHNVSHLKELGIVFTIPVETADGATLRLFSLLFHYLHEVPFYAKYFSIAAGRSEYSEEGKLEEKAVLPVDAKVFANTVISALRGDVRVEIPPVENLVSWMIVQRYLYKENPSDPRLALPHISPEALHWKRAADDIGEFGKENPTLGLDFWSGKAHVAGFFGGELVSFNFEDNVFSAVPGQNVEQYDYHIKEALWNKLFTEYFVEHAAEAKVDVYDLMEILMIEDFGQGFTGFKIRNSSVH